MDTGSGKTAMFVLGRQRRKHLTLARAVSRAQAALETNVPEKVISLGFSRIAVIHYNSKSLNFDYPDSPRSLLTFAQYEILLTFVARLVSCSNCTAMFTTIECLPA